MILKHLENFELLQADFIPYYNNFCHVCSEFYELQYIERGDVELCFNDRRFELHSGSLWLIHPGIKYDYRPLAPAFSWDHRYIVFRGDICQTWQNLNLLPQEPCQIESDKNLGIKLDRIIAIAHCWNNSNMLLKLEAANLLESVFLDLHYVHREKVWPDWLNLALNTLQHEKHVDYSELARRCHMTLRTFQRRFSELTQQSVHQYFLRSRAAQVDRYLATTELNIKEIAELLGYSDAAHLIRQYRRINGASPGSVRKKNPIRR